MAERRSRMAAFADAPYLCLAICDGRAVWMVTVPHHSLPALMRKQRLNANCSEWLIAIISPDPPRST